MNIKEKLIVMLNQALEKEHAAAIQYRAHAELVNGLYAEKIVERLKEIASDEEKHANMFRELIGSYLGGVPSMGLAETHKAKEIKAILKVNLKDEKEAVDFYQKIYQTIIDNKKDLPYIFEALEHAVRHIIIEEEEHITEIALLLGE